MVYLNEDGDPMSKTITLEYLFPPGSLYRYHYFDTPDKDDIHKKLFYLNKRAIPMALVYAGVNAHILENATKLQRARVFAKFFWPLPTAAVAYVATSSLSANLRGKDDSVNHLFAGFAAFYTLAVGIIAAKPGVATVAGVLGGVGCALYKKAAIMEGFSLVNLPNNRQVCLERPRDFTITDPRMDQRFKSSVW